MNVTDMVCTHKSIEDSFSSGVAKKILNNERLSFDDGIKLYEFPLTVLGYLANAKKEKLIANNYVTFVVDRVISYTNICNVQCKFCAFYRLPNQNDAYILSDEDIFKKIEELVSLGGTQVLFQGGVNPALNLNYFVRIFKEIKARYPIHLHSLSTVEIDYIARKEGKPLYEVISILKEAGLDSIPGAGAEILSERVRHDLSPLKISISRWLEIMETAHELEMHTTATMMYGSVETIEERIRHLILIRELQDKTGGFTAFIPWSFSPLKTELYNIVPATGLYYLKTIAIARLMLDNIKHIQSGWLTEGHKMAQIALSFGADDMGGTLIEDKVLGATGIKVNSSIEMMIHCIRRAGKIPVQRNTKYKIIRIFDET